MQGEGFKTLKGAAVAGAMGLGLFGGGSAARASSGTKDLALHVRITTNSKAYWWGQRSSFPVLVETSGSAAALSRVTSSGLLFGIQNTLVINPGALNDSLVEGFAILDGGLRIVQTIRDDIYDSAFQFSVNGEVYNNPDGNVDLSGNVLTTDPVLMSGVHANLQLAFGVGRPGVLRALYSFHNPGSAPASITVHIGGNLGSDRNTVLIASQSGDLQVTEADAWYVSNDSNGHTGDEPWKDPNFLLCRFTADAKVKPLTVAVPGQDLFANREWPDFFSESYDLTIGPDETARIVLFTEMTDNNASALAGAASCDSYEAMLNDGLLSGLDDQVISEIQNIRAAAAPAAPQSVPTMQAAALLGLSGALAALGLGGMRRRRPQR